MVTYQERMAEWKALYDFAYENYVELEAKGRMKAITLCMQRHWQDAQCIKQRAKPSERVN
jgi:hypothetical protein